MLQKKIGIRLYIEDYDPANLKDFLTAAYLLLDNILGERSNALHIGHLEIESLHVHTKREELIELVKLPKYIKWKRAQAET